MPFKREEQDERAVFSVMRVSHNTMNASMNSNFSNKQAWCSCFEKLNRLRSQCPGKPVIRDANERPFECLGFVFSPVIRCHLVQKRVMMASFSENQRRMSTVKALLYDFIDRFQVSSFRMLTYNTQANVIRGQWERDQQNGIRNRRMEKDVLGALRRFGCHRTRVGKGCGFAKDDESRSPSRSALPSSRKQLGLFVILGT